MSIVKKLALLSLFCVLMTFVVSVSAADITWKGNGITNGDCNTVTSDPSVPVGQQRWLFVLTSPATAASYQLTTVFSPLQISPANPIPGVKQANGSVQFTVYTTDFASLISAVATNGTTKSVLTVSHCEVNPPPLQVTKTAATSLTRTYSWEITKSVSPTTLDMFVGDSKTASYTVSVTKTGSTDSAWAVAGSITVNNPSVRPATITGINDVVSGGAGAAGVMCNVSFPYTLAAGGTLVCSYTKSLPDAASRINTAAAMTSGLVPGGSGTAAVEFGGATVNSVNASVNVDDSNGSSWAFSDSGSTSYDRTFTCGADAGIKNNTATIRETSQQASASVTVNCYSLSVAKTAKTDYTRTYNWSIAKSVDTSSFDLFTGSSGTANYTVTATKVGYTDGAFTVSGEITITNPAPIPAPIASVTDQLSNGSYITVNCGVATSVAANGYIVCIYSSPVNDASPLTNTATVNLQNTPSGTSAYTASAAVSFGDPSSIVNASVTVSDTVAGVLGTISDTQAFTYPRTFTCDADAGDHPNTASLSTGQNASASVHVSCKPIVTPPPPMWCSPGFWAQNMDTLKGTAYDPTPYLNNPVPGFEQYTVGFALANPGVVKGPAFNAAANYLASIFFAPNNGTQPADPALEYCPIDAFGNPK